MNEIGRLLEQNPDMALNRPDYEMLLRLAILEWFPFYEDEQSPETTHKKAINEALNENISNLMKEKNELYYDIAKGHQFALKVMYSGYEKSLNEIMLEDKEGIALQKRIDNSPYLRDYLSLEESIINKIFEARKYRNKDTNAEFRSTLSEAKNILNENLRENFKIAPIGIITQLDIDITKLLDNDDAEPYNRKLDQTKKVKYFN